MSSQANSLKFAGPWPRACQILGLWKGTCVFNTFCFNTCFSFQQSTISSNPFSFFATSQQSSQFFTPVLRPVYRFLQKISNSASTAARTTVFCLYGAHVRLPLREPPGIGLGTCLNLEGHLFLKQFLEPFFSHKNHIFCQKNTHKVTRLKVFREPF